MNMKYLGLGIVGIIVLIAIILGVIYMVSYNTMVGLDQDVNAKWSEVENQYQRQADLIPNFVDTVKSQVSVETKFVKDVIAARTAWQGAGTSQLAKDTAGQQMNSGINAFVNAVAESYPNLAASEAYTALRDELAGTQNRITTSRGRYIESIQSYNTTIRSIPYNFFSGMFGFSVKEYYTANPSSMETPDLNGMLPQ